MIDGPYCHSLLLLVREGGRKHHTSFHQHSLAPSCISHPFLFSFSALALIPCSQAQLPHKHLPLFHALIPPFLGQHTTLRFLHASALSRAQPWLDSPVHSSLAVSFFFLRIHPPLAVKLYCCIFLGTFCSSPPQFILVPCMCPSSRKGNVADGEVCAPPPPWILPHAITSHRVIVPDGNPCATCQVSEFRFSMSDVLPGLWHWSRVHMSLSLEDRWRGHARPCMGVRSALRLRRGIHGDVCIYSSTGR